MTRLSVACGLLIGLLAAPAVAASVSLNPSKDNTLIQITGAVPPGDLSNGLGDIFVGRTNQDGQGTATISIRRGLIAFDVAGSGIPANATLTSVTLTLRDVMGLNGDPVTTLHRTSADWGEGTSFQGGGMGAAATENDATWLYRFYNAANPAASPAWSSPGGDFSATASASSIISDDLGGGQSFSWTSASDPQMLADVQDWLINPAANFGWTIRGDETMGQTAKRLNSGESTIAPNVPPVLTIEYVVIPEPASLALAAIASSIGLRKSRSRRRHPARR